jgi:hypothetical protein
MKNIAVAFQTTDVELPGSWVFVVPCPTPTHTALIETNRTSRTIQPLGKDVVNHLPGARP